MSDATHDLQLLAASSALAQADVAYRAGADAFAVPFANGEPIPTNSANPYPEGSEYRTWWSRGYRSSARLLYGERHDLVAAVAKARRSLSALIDHFDAKDGENDSAELAADLRAIHDGLAPPKEPAS